MGMEIVVEEQNHAAMNMKMCAVNGDKTIAPHYFTLYICVIQMQRNFFV